MEAGVEFDGRRLADHPNRCAEGRAGESLQTQRGLSGVITAAWVKLDGGQQQGHHRLEERLESIRRRALFRGKLARAIRRLRRKLGAGSPQAQQRPQTEQNGSRKVHTVHSQCSAA